jgi:hypothetical protein
MAMNGDDCSATRPHLSLEDSTSQLRHGGIFAWLWGTARIERRKQKKKELGLIRDVLSLQ